MDKLSFSDSGRLSLARLSWHTSTTLPIAQGVPARRPWSLSTFGRKAGQEPPDGTGGSNQVYWQILSTNLFSFFNVILFAVSVVLILFGRYNDAMITGITGVASALIRTFQEVRAKRQLDKIALLVRPHATVIRNGQEQSVDVDHIAMGELIHLHSGDQALADGIMVGEKTAEVDESLLTGESNLVRKQPGDRIYSGSFCVAGELLYHADAVGAASYANQLAASARTFTQATTPLQQQLAFITRILMLLAVCMAAMFYVGGYFQQSSLLYYVTGSAVLIGLVPYGLFLTISLAYTLGALSIARHGAIVQRTHAVESLEHVDVLCMDKTGTLTTNALQLEKVQPWQADEALDVARLLGDFVCSASAVNNTTLALRQGLAGRQRKPVDEVPFVSARKWSALAFDESDMHGVYVLGAFEMLQPYLANDAVTPSHLAQMQAWAEQGLRVLLFACNQETTTVHNPAGAPFLSSLQPLALVTLRDELRPYAQEMLQKFTVMGVAIKIISGDSPHTVAGLAKQVGLVNPKLVSGPELAKMSDTEVEQAAEEGTIFGRITPEQKAHLVDALVRRGHYVAMMGDGVNDILALKRAKLSVAMQSGSNATRTVADMVLLNDSYAALAPALREGQRISSGVINATYLTLTRAFTYAFVIIGVLMAGLPFPFEPAQTGVTTITVALPALFLTLWARPKAEQEPLLPSFARFVLPAAIWTTVIGVTLFAYVHVHVHEFIENVPISSSVIETFEQYLGVTYEEEGGDFTLSAATIYAQTALTVFLSLCALGLLFFLEPPIRWLAGWRSVSPDPRPALLALVLTTLFLVGLNLPVVASYLGMIPLRGLAWRDIVVGMVVWVLGLWLLWRNRWMDRFLRIGA
jgi:cation-transporting ATPase E